jgi:hypothetical protein
MILAPPIKPLEPPGGCFGHKSSGNDVNPICFISYSNCHKLLPMLVPGATREQKGAMRGKTGRCGSCLTLKTGGWPPKLYVTIERSVLYYHFGARLRTSLDVSIITE